MTPGLEALSGASAASRADHHRPDLFRTALPADRERLKELLDRTPAMQVFDQLPAQLDELVRLARPHQRLTPEQAREAVQQHVGNTPLQDYGVWVYYPWSQRLVHLLDEAEFAAVRTDRNRNKITREEQARLSRLKVGVIGLSVGQSVSLTMALERGFGEIRLADFDRLDLSNLNRIRSGVHNLGINKVVNVAREIAEIDPFLRVTCFPEGLTKTNMDAFFSEGGDLDVLVEECDSVDIKILARQKAKALRIPVVMDMSDRGVVDVERFDLEPDRPLMHGWIDHLDLDAAGRPMTPEEKVPYMLPISGVETLSARMKASVIELGTTVSAWPQLATSVVLGGALAGDVVRRIALDQFHASGRWFIDLDELIADRPTTVAAPDRPMAVPPEEAIVPALDALPVLPPDAAALTDDQFTELVKAGALAPSAGNVQPWRFLLHEGRLLLVHDRNASASFWDPDHLIAQIALGACVENMVLRAHALGLEVRTDVGPVPAVPALIATLTAFPRGTAGTELHVMDELAGEIGRRHTNRKVVQRQELPAAVAERMAAAARSMEGCGLELFAAPAELDELAAICGAAERIRVVNPIGHREFFRHEVRWTPEEAQRTGDGLDIATLELSIMDQAGLRIAADPRAMDLVDRWNGGRGLERLAGRAIRAASACALVTVPDDRLHDRIAGGRAMERAWMAANAAGWSVHPISAPLFLTHALDFPMEGLRPAERRELELLRTRLAALRHGRSGHPLFLMRLSLAGEASVRSLRRPLNELVLHALTTRT